MLEYLRHTGAVPLVKQVRRDYDKELSGFAARLLDSWKAVILELQKKRPELGGTPRVGCAATRQPVRGGRALSVSSSSSDSSGSSTDEDTEAETRGSKKESQSFAPMSACACSR